LAPKFHVACLSYSPPNINNKISHSVTSPIQKNKIVTVCCPL
jgi:hypothetical protein